MGVTVIVAEIGDVPVLVAVKDKFPDPLDARPMAVLLFDQAYVVVPPVLLVVNITPVASELHTTILAGSFTCPFGFTLIVNVWAVPEHETEPLVNVGVTVMVAVIVVVPELVAVNDGILPVPLAPRPMLVLLLLHA